MEDETGTVDELVHGTGIHIEIRHRDTDQGTLWRFQVAWWTPDGRRRIIAGRREYRELSRADRAGYRFVRAVCGKDVIPTAANAPSCEEAIREAWQRYPGLFRGTPPPAREQVA